MRKRAFLLSSTLLIGIAALAQPSPEGDEAPANADELEQLDDQSSTEAVSEAPAPEGEPAEVDPLAEIDAEEQREVQATMERFEPSEKISEDRAVAYPNDI